MSMRKGISQFIYQALMFSNQMLSFLTLYVVEMNSNHSCADVCGAVFTDQISDSTSSITYPHLKCRTLSRDTHNAKVGRSCVFGSGMEVLALSEFLTIFTDFLSLPRSCNFEKGIVLLMDFLLPALLHTPQGRG